MSVDRIDVRFFDVVLCVSRALDLLTPAFSDHHLRVAYIASCLADALGLGLQDSQDVVVAGALHDVGAVSAATRLSLLDYSLSSYQPGGSQPSRHLHRHGHDGYQLLREFAPFAGAAQAIRFHHVAWNHGTGAVFDGVPVPLASRILHLADRIAVLPDARRNILEQAEAIRRKIAEGEGRLYERQLIQAFEAVSSRESFWLDLVSPHKEEIIRARFGEHEVSLHLDELYELARVFGKIIDYRSPYTAIHSSSVAATSEILAGLLGMSAFERRLIGVAGFLHDLGKLAVPTEVLDKPGKLTPEEMLLVKQHPYYTHRILATVTGLETVDAWASLHHERLDGMGYPFRRSDIPTGSRIIAVADILTATTEKRPYRDGMSMARSLALLDALAIEGAIDGDIVALVHAHAYRFDATQGTLAA